MDGDVLCGQDTLLASWGALGRLSAGARLVRSDTAVAAVFPAWRSLSNAIVLGPVDEAGVATAATAVSSVFGDAGVDEWALWVPSRATDLDAPDGIRALDGFDRDLTTLVMRADLGPGLDTQDGVVRVSLAAALRAGEEPVPVAELGEPDDLPGFGTWAIVVDGAAVASAWSYRHGTDCGIYAVGTVPAYRRRGLATALLRHVLAVTRRDGARTATLQSTRMAVTLYESLGFVAVGRYEEWAVRRGANSG